MLCSQCGTLLPDGSVFCNKCGATQGVPSAPRVQPVTPPQYRGYDATPDVRKRPTIITILAVLNYAGAGFYLLGAALLAFLAAKQDKDFILFASLAGGAALLALLQFMCGRGLWNMEGYGRSIQIAFSILGLLGFPVGTIISVLILVYLYKPEVKILFSGRTIQELNPSEIALLRKFETSGVSGAAIAAGIAIALFVGIAVIGIISAIAIPNLLNAIQRGKQKRTIADMRSIGTACEAYAVDNNMYPDVQTIEQLAPVLEPTYINKLPQKDAWERNFTFQSWKDREDIQGPNQYVLISGGKDGSLDHDSLEDYESGETTSFNSDIVFSAGSFLQYPEGAQQ